MKVDNVKSNMLWAFLKEWNNEIEGQTKRQVEQAGRGAGEVRAVI
jgi:hypothetical protein